MAVCLAVNFLLPLVAGLEVHKLMTRSTTTATVTEVTFSAVLHSNNCASLSEIHLTVMKLHMVACGCLTLMSLALGA